MVNTRQRELALLEYYVGVRRGADGESGVQKRNSGFATGKMTTWVSLTLPISLRFLGPGSWTTLPLTTTPL